MPSPILNKRPSLLQVVHLWLLFAPSSWALRAQIDAWRSSPCNGARGYWLWNASKDPEEYYDVRNEADEHVADAQKSFVPTEEVPFLKAFMWEWQPQNPACVFTKMSHRTFCAAMEKHNLTRFMMVGDSLSFTMAESFWGLLHMPGGEGVGRQIEGYVQHNISCSHGDVLFKYVRNDNLDNATERENMTVNPWWGQYVNSTEPTLLVVNAGLHCHSMEEFRAVFDPFVDRLETVSAQARNRQDRLYFRLSVPGHEACWKFDKPLAEIGEFKLDGLMAMHFRWDMVPDFNQYVLQKLASLSVPLEALDAYELTILRPDGHRGAQFDCLHYYLPSVVDWWSHLLVTELLA